MGKTYDPSNLLFKVYKYDRWYNKLGEVRESYEEKSKSQTDKTVAERLKLISHKRKMSKKCYTTNATNRI